MLSVSNSEHFYHVTCSGGGQDQDAPDQGSWDGRASELEGKLRVGIQRHE